MIKNNEQLTKSIKIDDLENFKQYFILDNWKESITTIENYAGLSQYITEVSYNDCDVIKYALHCNADKIFHYLLPLVDTDKHGENYGWPLLAMALKNNRYDYATVIINHKNFNPYPMYHTNAFSHIDSRYNPKKHIDFLFKYLHKFDKWDFNDPRLIYVFTHLICYNEETYQRVEFIYRDKMNNFNISILNIFKEKMSTLGKEIFYNHFKPFILDKLNNEQLRAIFESVMDDNIIFVKLFEGQHAQEGLTYLMKNPDLLQQYFNRNQVICSYLPRECLIFLDNNKIDFFIEDKNGMAAIDFILEDNDLSDIATAYFFKKYAVAIYNKYKEKKNKTNVKQYCYNQLFEN